jgi:hypothetical protein
MEGPRQGARESYPDYPNGGGSCRALIVGEWSENSTLSIGARAVVTK